MLALPMGTAVIVIVPEYVPGDSPAEFTVTTIVEGAWAVMGLPVSQLPPETVVAVALQPSAPSPELDMSIIAGEGLEPTATVKLIEAVLSVRLAGRRPGLGVGGVGGDGGGGVGGGGVAAPANNTA